MEYAEKMYLVPQHQLDKARTENVRETIQQSVENDLDVAMRNILLIWTRTKKQNFTQIPWAGFSGFWPSLNKAIARAVF